METYPARISKGKAVHTAKEMGPGVTYVCGGPVRPECVVPAPGAEVTCKKCLAKEGR